MCEFVFEKLKSYIKKCETIGDSRNAEEVDRSVFKTFVIIEHVCNIRLVFGRILIFDEDKTKKMDEKHSLLQKR
jgi:hypothetical protein